MNNIFITGEKIQNLCDIYLGTHYITFNPHINKSKIVNIHNLIQPFDNPKLIYCYTHILSKKNINKNRHVGVSNFIKKLRLFKNPFNLIFHNSDHKFVNEYLILFEELPLLQHIYTQNMEVNHEKVSPLPIGFANLMWKHGNNKIHQEVYNMNIYKTKNIYFNFNINTNKLKRSICLDIIKHKGVSWNNNLPYREYLIELKKHRYAICPEGNGTDTHRFWECLYMDVVPICKKNILNEYYSKFFPIILLNDWGELDINSLNNKTSINHKYLDIEYIKNFIDLK